MTSLTTLRNVRLSLNSGIQNNVSSQYVISSACTSPNKSLLLKRISLLQALISKRSVPKAVLKRYGLLLDIVCDNKVTVVPEDTCNKEDVIEMFEEEGISSACLTRVGIKNKDCPITLEEFKVGDVVVAFSCGHMVSQRGWDGFLKVANTSELKCVMCRRCVMASATTMKTPCRLEKNRIVRWSYMQLG